ncbi:putative membrane protein [Rhodanobacter sp. TND4EL1]
MGTSSLAALAGMGLFAMLVTMVVGILLAALVLSFAFRFVVGYMPSYPRALGAVVLTWIAGVVAMIIIGMVSSGGAGGFLSLIVQFLVGAFVVNYMLLSDNGSQIGFGKACVVQVIYLVIFIVLAVIIGLMMAAFFGGMMAHG